ncbi:MAG: ribbon-helix-helix domain-containing protein [Planctomycetota bacterium]
MPKTQTSIKIDSDLMARVDRLAKMRGESRTAVIERCLRNAVPELEQYFENMQNPAFRAAQQLITRNPKVLRAISAALLEELPQEEAERIARVAAADRQRAKESKRSKKKTGKRSKPADGEFEGALV